MECDDGYTMLLKTDLNCANEFNSYFMVAHWLCIQSLYSSACFWILILQKSETYVIDTVEWHQLWWKRSQICKWWHRGRLSTFFVVFSTTTSVLSNNSIFSKRIFAAIAKARQTINITMSLEIFGKTKPL